MELEVTNGSFYSGSRKVFLNSGEIHYFRIKREYWDKHLESAREAGLFCVSSYVPWDWHEPLEGSFDFSGTTIPERDLEGWLNRCKAHGLQCILKPGPFILAEWRGAGLPDWLLDQYGNELKMRNRKGEIVQSDGVNLFHPVYLNKVTHWYDNVMPLIRKYQSSAGGPVMMLQVCNEIGVFAWLAHQADYSREARERFLLYLKKKFSGIHEINNLWGTNYQQFEEIELPPDGKQPYTSKGDRGRDYEWHCFWRTFYGDYLRMLTNMIRERGINVPLYHNLPGWIYGHGYEFPVNITMYDDLYADKSEIIFGVDHIPEFVSHRNMHDDRIINDITRAMQGNKPLFAAEFQSGSREYHVVTNPREMELFYKASIANGLKGWNYYMFSQGRNPQRKGYSGDTFYWFTPLTPEAEKTSSFPLVKRMSKLVHSLEDIITSAERKAEICVLLYPPYYATELERPETGASELVFNASAIRRQAYFDGLLKALQVLNIEYDMADLTKINSNDLEKYKQVWAFSTDEMNAIDQQVILNYLLAGGKVVMFPAIPDREMNQQPCTILQDAVGFKPSVIEVIDSPLIDIFHLKDIKCANPQLIYSENSLADAEVIARNIKGNVCGFRKKIGNGSIIHLGTWIGFDTEGHKPAYEALLKTSGAKLRQADTGNEFLTARQRFTADKKAILFAGNYYNEEHAGKISYTHPETGERISIPYSGNAITWPALYSILTPVCMPVSEGLNILHSTSDILNVAVDSNQIQITLFGDRDLIGEMVLEGGNISKISSATLEGELLNLRKENGRLVLNYEHTQRKEMMLIMGLNS